MESDILIMCDHLEQTEIIRRLFRKHVPEVVSGSVELRGIAREPGNRTLVAVESKTAGVDAVGACLGDRGTRVNAMLAELPKEHVDIVMWGGSVAQFLGNYLAPNRSIHVSLDQNLRRATVTVPSDCPPLCDLRLRLASRLSGWDVKAVQPGAG